MAARVLPDANVLYSRTLRDWIIMLSQDDGENSMLVNEYLPRRVIDVTRRQADYWRTIAERRGEKFTAKDL